jgi:hypothetical protein
MITLNINVNGSMTQQIKLLEDYKHITEEEFLSGVKNGTILTSIGHNDNNGFVYRITNGFECIGMVSSQSSNDDMEIEYDELSE